MCVGCPFVIVSSFWFGGREVNNISELGDRFTWPPKVIVFLYGNLNGSGIASLPLVMVLLCHSSSSFCDAAGVITTSQCV